MTPGRALEPDERWMVSLTMVLGAAALHLLRLGSRLPLAWRPAFTSYFSDIVVPFGFYFLLCTQESRTPRLMRWGVKAALVFAAATFAELAQGAGIPLLGRTFDPWDVLMYAAGVLLAVAVDRLALPQCRF